MSIVILFIVMNEGRSLNAGTYLRERGEREREREREKIIILHAYFQLITHSLRQTSILAKPDLRSR